MLKLTKLIWSNCTLSGVVFVRKIGLFSSDCWLKQLITQGVGNGYHYEFQAWQSIGLQTVTKRSRVLFYAVGIHPFDVDWLRRQLQFIAPSTLQIYMNAITGLRTSGYQGLQGGAFLFTNASCPTFVGIFGNCFGNNSAAPYVVPPPVGDTYEDPDYAVPLDTYTANGVKTNIICRLSDNNALISVVQYPTTAAYFGFQSYVFTSAISNYTTTDPLQVVAPHGSNPLSRYELFASIGNDVNNVVVVQNHFQNPWNGQVVYVTTSNQVQADDLVQQLSANGVNAKAIMIEKIGANVVTGKGAAADDLVSLIRYAVPQNQNAANAWLNDVNANVKVYKVSKQTSVARYPNNRYTRRSSNSELATLLNGWMASVQPTQTIQTEKFRTLTLYNPVTQTPSGLAGSDCIHKGTIFDGDNQDT